MQHIKARFIFIYDCEWFIFKANIFSLLHSLFFKCGCSFYFLLFFFFLNGWHQPSSVPSFCNYFVVHLWMFEWLLSTKVMSSSLVVNLKATLRNFPLNCKAQNISKHASDTWDTHTDQLENRIKTEKRDSIQSYVYIQ